MKTIAVFTLLLISLLANQAFPQSAKPLRVAIVGLVHGHVEGFLGPALKRNDIAIVGIAEPDQAVADKYAKQFQLDRKLLYADVEPMIAPPIRKRCLYIRTLLTIAAPSKSPPGTAFP
jgi:hypothetical protein